MKRIFSAVILTLACAFSAMATQLTVSSGVIVTNWNAAWKAPAHLRIVANDTFTPKAASYQVIKGDATSFYRDSACTVTLQSVACAAVTLDATTDSDNPYATYTAYLQDAAGNIRATFLSRFKVPASLGASATWAQIIAYNKSAPIPLPSTYYTADQINQMIQNVGALSLADGSVSNQKLAAGIDAAKVGFGTVSNVQLDFLSGATSNVQSQLNAHNAQISIASSQISTISSSLASKAPTDSPHFTGVPTSQTAASGDASNQIATDAFVIANIGAAGAVTATSATTFQNKVVNGTNNTILNIPETAITNLSADLSAKAPITSPSFGGTPLAPTAADASTPTQIATVGYVATHSSAGVADGSITNQKVATGIDAAKIGNGTVPNAQFQYLSGATSNIQTQINSTNSVVTTNTSNIAINSNAITTNAAAIALKANSISPNFSGTPTAPTAADASTPTQVATTGFVVANSGLPKVVSAIPSSSAANLFYKETSTGKLFYTSAANVFNEIPQAGITVTGVPSGGTGVTTFSKGDILVATSATTLARLPVGNNGQILTADSTTVTGLKWATLAAGGTNAAPVASAVTITGTKQVTSTLAGSYTYADAESDAQGTSTFKWYRADDNTGTNVAAISGATSLTYTLASADLGKFIRFGVVPVAVSGTSPGTEAFSAYTTAIAAAPSGGGSVTFNGLVNATSTGNSVVQISTGVAMKANTVQTISSNSGSDSYFQFTPRSGTNLNSMHIYLMPSGGAPYTSGAGETASLDCFGGRCYFNFAGNGAGIDFAVAAGDVVRFGYDGANHVRIWNNGTIITTYTTTAVTTQASVLYIFGDNDGVTHGLDSVTYQ